MVKSSNEILVKIVNQVVGEGALIKEKNLISEINKGNGDLSRTYEEQTANQRKRVTVTEKETQQGKRVHSVNKEVLAQGPRFKMHYLGIMFGGMALNRAMSSLTQTSKEWVGIGELMSTTMGVVMLPATLELLDEAVLPLMDALLSLPPEIQTTIGVTVFGLEGLGKVAEFGGQIALGAAAFSYQFPAMSKAITEGLSTQLAKNLGKGLVIAVGLAIAWQSVDFIREGIEKGNMAEEIGGVVGVSLGLAAVGLALGIPAAGVFPLAIGIGLIIDWSIAENRWTKKAKDLNISDKDIGEHAVRSTVLGSILSSGKDASPEYLKNAGLVNWALNPDSYSSFAVGGNVSNTGLHFLHEGETVLRKDQVDNQSGNISVTYNVNVSDKREFEQMLKNNNQQLVREVRRNATI